MARDYKHRAQNNRTSQHSSVRESAVGFWQWMMITVLLISFAVLLAYLGTKKDIRVTSSNNSQKSSKLEVGETQEKQTEIQPQPFSPRFDFYNILPSKELVIPDYEIKTRTREERSGKTKATKYILQAGSFKDSREANQLRAKLALMGIESVVEKTKVGSVTWSRVRLGPYARMSSVSTIQTRLKRNGVDVVVTEVSGG